MSLTTSRTELPASPYKGLMPYGVEDAPFFFGRDTERENISANLMASRLTLLYGPSGVGKSSVLMAGVANSLLMGARQKLDGFELPGYAVVVFNDWKDDPIDSLNRQIEKAVHQLFEDYQLEPVPPSRLLVESLKLWTERVKGKLLIVLDQFEEYFLYHPQEDGEGTFAYEFPVALNRADLKVNFLISIREDALAKLDKFKGRIPGLFDNYLRIDYLSQEGAKAAIEKPIAEYNRLLPAGVAAYSIEPELVETVLEELKAGRVQLGESGSGKLTHTGQAETRIETPYLQLVMTRLWETEIKNGASKLKLATLTRLGGAEEIVRTHLDEVLATLTEGERETVARIFRHLVTPSGAKIAHSLTDLADYTKKSRTEIEPILAKLGSREIRIVRPVESPGGKAEDTRYEIYHDVLAKAILAWRTKYEKVEAVRETELANRARVRRLLRLGALLGLGFLFVLGLAIVAIVSATDANTQRNNSDNSRATAQAEANRAVTAESNTQEQKQVAEQQRNVAITAQANTEQQKQEAEKQRQLADEQKKEAQASGLVAQARLFQDKGPDLAMLLSVEANRLKDSLATRGNLAEAVNNSLVNTFLRGHTSAVNSVAFSPDGKTITSGSQDSSIILWEVGSGKQLAQLKGHTDEVTSVAFSPDGKTLASGSWDHTIILWEVGSGKQLAQLKGHTDGVLSVAFSPNGKTLASGSYDNTIILWEVGSGKQLAQLKGHTDEVISVAFSPDGKTLASGSWDHTIILWEIASDKQLNQLKGHTNWVYSVAFSPDGKTLASGSADNTIILWEIDTGRQLNQLRGHTSTVTSVAFSPDGKTLASGSEDGTIILWIPGFGKQPDSLKNLKSNVNSITFSPDGKTLASGSQDNSIILWEVSSGKQLAQLKGHTSAVNSVAFSPDGKTLASGSTDGNSILWEVASGKQLNQLRGHVNGVRSVAFSPDGKTLASGGGDKTIIIWEVARGKQLNQLRGHIYGVRSVAFSPDGKTLASGSQDNSIILWEVSSGKQLAQLKGHTNWVYSVAFSPDGKTLASGSTDNTIILWEIDTGKQLNQLKGHTNYVYSVIFSPDGKTLASGSTDGNSILWEVGSGQQLAQFKDPTDYVRSLAFLPDGKNLVSGSWGTDIIFRDVGLESLQAKACHIANRNLTQLEWTQFLGDQPYQKTCPDLP